MSNIFIPPLSVKASPLFVCGEKVFLFSKNMKKKRHKQTVNFHYFFALNFIFLRVDSKKKNIFRYFLLIFLEFFCCCSWDGNNITPDIFFNIILFTYFVKLKKNSFRGLDFFCNIYFLFYWAWFSPRAASSLPILRPCLRTVAFNFLISSKSSSILTPSGKTAPAAGVEAGVPFEIWDTRKNTIMTPFFCTAHRTLQNWALNYFFKRRASYHIKA